MAKKKESRRAKPQPVAMTATIERYNGGAVKVEIVIQPRDAAHLVDQAIQALVDLKNGL